MVTMTEGMNRFEDSGYLHDAVYAIEEFKGAVEGRVPYNSDSEEIQIWEEFLICWLDGGTFEDKREYMLQLFHSFRDRFSYSGELWRGMTKEADDDLYPMPVASYSDDDEVAFSFAGASEFYGGMDEELLEGQSQHLLKVDAERALALDDLLQQILKLTTNKDLKNEIMLREWEREKIYPMTAYMLDSVRPI